MAGEVFVAGTLTPASGPNTFPAMADIDLKNGCRVVANLAARNAISSLLLTAGALVLVLDSDGSGTFASYRFLGGDPTVNGNWTTFVDPGVTVIDASPTVSVDNIMSTFALADNTIYEFQVSVTVRNTGNLLFSAYHSQKWARAGGGVATLIHTNDPTQVDGIGVGVTASTMVASTNSVLLKFNPLAISTRYHADVYTRSVALAHA